jgi:hypothetical protein
LVVRLEGKFLVQCSHNTLLDLRKVPSAIFAQAAEWKLWQGENLCRRLKEKIGGKAKVFPKKLPKAQGLQRFLGAFSFLAIAAFMHSDKYPAHWWTPIIDPHKPDWEILPQSAKPGEVILSKRNELGILSNFAATPFTLDNKRYASVEGFWQMMLYPENDSDPRAHAPGITWRYSRDEVSQMTSFQAKSAGALAEENMRLMSIDWVTFEGKRMPYRSMKPGEHYRLIREGMEAKLNQNPRVREILLSTGDLILRPDHIPEENAPPEWAYFQIWMEIRTQLQKQPGKGS